MSTPESALTPSEATKQLPPADSRIVEQVALDFPRTVADLGKLVRIPGVAWPSWDQSALQRSAEAVADLARETGLFESVQIERSKIPDTEELGQPAVLATRPARNGAATILLYAHHDVQPVGDESLWETPPFEPTIRDGRIYARGAADDKVGVMVHIAALRALAVSETPDPDLGIVLFVEGEEEYGSRSFPQFLRDHSAQLRADAIIVADSGNWDTETPGLTVSLRGNVCFTMTVRTLEHASHSGMFGGAVPDAMMTAVQLLATLWDSDGAVAVTGLSDLPGGTPHYLEQTLRAETGLLPGAQTIGRDDLLGRIWNRPAVTITGMDVTSVAEASNTLLPEVSVVVSARISPDQPAEEAFEALRSHLVTHTPYGATVTFTDIDCGNGFLAAQGGPASIEARRALTDGYGQEAVELGIGGSIPFIADLVREFPNAEILITGVEDPNSRAHSPNESLHIDTFRKAITSEALFLARMNRQ